MTATTKISFTYEIKIALSPEELDLEVEPLLNEGYCRAGSGETALNKFNPPLAVYFQVLVKTEIVPISE